MHPTLAYSDGHLAVSTLDGTCLVYKIVDSSTAATPMVIESKQISDKKVDDDAKGVVLCVSYSGSGKYMAMCNDYKQLLLYTLAPGKSPQFLAQVRLV